jgi:hypothetical protein
MSDDIQVQVKITIGTAHIELTGSREWVGSRLADFYSMFGPSATNPLKELETKLTKIKETCERYVQCAENILAKFPYVNGGPYANMVPGNSCLEKLEHLVGHNRVVPNLMDQGRLACGCAIDRLNEQVQNPCELHRKFAAALVNAAIHTR